MQGTGRIVRLIEKVKKLNYWLLIIPMLALVGMMFLDAANAITIKLFSVRATPAQKELIEELLIVVVYVGMAYTLLERGHIKTDMLKNRFGPNLRFAADMLSDLACMVLFGYMAWASVNGAIYNLVRHSIKQGEITLPLSPFYVILAASIAMLFFASVLVFINHIHLRSSPDSQTVQ